MFVYEKKLQYPVRIANPNPKLAAAIISQYGGPDGELGASLRYLSQRYAMPYAELKGLLTDIGTEELGHLEMIGTIVHQLTRNLSEKDIKTAGFDAYFVDHTTGVYPAAASGFPWNAASIAVTGDVIADLTEDLSAEQKARVTYDNILRLSDDPDVNDVIKFLRAREVVHFQRFGEGLRLAREKMDQKNVYFTNPAFDKYIKSAADRGLSDLRLHYYSFLFLLHRQDKAGAVALGIDLPACVGSYNAQYTGRGIGLQTPSLYLSAQGQPRLVHAAVFAVVEYRERPALR